MASKIALCCALVAVPAVVAYAPPSGNLGGVLGLRAQADSVSRRAFLGLSAAVSPCIEKSPRIPCGRPPQIMQIRGWVRRSLAHARECAMGVGRRLLLRQMADVRLENRRPASLSSLPRMPKP